MSGVVIGRGTGEIFFDFTSLVKSIGLPLLWALVKPYKSHFFVHKIRKKELNNNYKGGCSPLGADAQPSR